LTDLEHWLLLTLSVLIARQRALVAGEPDSVPVAALRQPETFPFAYARGAHRSRFAQDRLARFQTSVLVLEKQDFVSPVSALKQHLRLLEPAPGTVEVKLLPHFVEGIALADDDPVRVYYSPLQVLFDPSVGFFDPRRAPWHAYAGRALAVRLPNARVACEATQTRVTWPAGTLELADGPAGAVVSARTTVVEFDVGIEAQGFEVQVRAADPAGGLMADLLRLRTGRSLPIGVAATGDGANGLRLRGGV
jgi:hypothetical protein